MNAQHIKHRVLIVVWMKFHRRATSLAQHIFKGPVYFLGYRLGRSKIFRPLEYLVKMLHTCLLLINKRPDLVVVQSPPAPAPITVMLYHLLFRTPYVVDAHSSAVTLPLWFRFPFYKLALKKAIIVLVHNKNVRELLNSKGINSMVLSDPLPVLSCDNSFKPKGNKFRFIFLMSPDLRTPKVVGLIRALATEIPEAEFYVVGAAGEGLQFNIANIVVTGYLSNEEYDSLLNNGDAIIVLQEREDRDYVQSCRAMEAISAIKPLIISDTTLNRELFGNSAILVKHNLEDLKAACLDVMRRHGEYREKMKKLRDAMKVKFDSELQILEKIIAKVLAN